MLSVVRSRRKRIICVLFRCLHVNCVNIIYMSEKPIMSRSSDCSDPNVLPHGSFVVTKGHTLVEYTCITNFSLNGARTRSCMDQGRGWSDTDPECGTGTLNFHYFNRDGKINTFVLLGLIVVLMHVWTSVLNVKSHFFKHLHNKTKP